MCRDTIFCAQTCCTYAIKDEQLHCILILLYTTVFMCTQQIQQIYNLHCRFVKYKFIYVQRSRFAMYKCDDYVQGYTSVSTDALPTLTLLCHIIIHTMSHHHTLCCCYEGYTSVSIDTLPGCIQEISRGIPSQICTQRCTLYSVQMPYEYICRCHIRIFLMYIGNKQRHTVVDLHAEVYSVQCIDAI